MVCTPLTEALLVRILKLRRCKARAFNSILRTSDPNKPVEQISTMYTPGLANCDRFSETIIARTVLGKSSPNPALSALKER